MFFSEANNLLEKLRVSWVGAIEFVFPEKLPEKKYY